MKWRHGRLGHAHGLAARLIATLAVVPWLYACSPAANMTTGSGAPPTVVIVQPVNNTTVAASQPVTIQVEATGSASIVSVDVRVNGLSYRTLTAAPYSVTWTPPANGNFQLIAVATNESSQSASSIPILISVKPAPPAPIVTPPKRNPTSSSGIYTPAPGSDVRGALMDAAREAADDWTQRYSVYELHVYGSWAVGELAVVGYQHMKYEDVFAWRRSKGHWTCLIHGGDTGVGDEPKPTIRAGLRDLGMPAPLVNALQFK